MSILMYVCVVLCSEETLEPFCNIPRGSTTGTRTDCTYDHLSVGVCNLIQFSGTLPLEFQVTSIV